MSLLQCLSFKEYKEACDLSQEDCEIIAELANLTLSFNHKKPGELLIKALDKYGYGESEYNYFMNICSSIRESSVYYKPQSKFAILIANDKYEYLTKLATPSIDCDSLAANLNKIGFIVIMLKNIPSNELRKILQKLFTMILEDSYCFVFYAGHGFEICNTKCILTIDSPKENIKLEHCITENFILQEVAKFKPDLCVLIMDMCRNNLDRISNPDIYKEITSVKEYPVYKNLYISYSTQSNQSAYEIVQIECTDTIDNMETYELKTGDTDKILPGSSQYVNALCTRLAENINIGQLLDKVHEDVEKSLKKQRPIKVHCGVAKRSLCDPAIGDIISLLNKLKNFCNDNKNANLVY